MTMLCISIPAPEEHGVHTTFDSCALQRECAVAWAPSFTLGI